MAVIQVTTVTTLNPSPDRTEAVGKDTKRNGKLSEPLPAPLRAHSEQLVLKSKFNPVGVLKEGRSEEQAFGPSALSGIPKTPQRRTSSLVQLD
jgi:hypothetical protein